ncbi:ATP-dependent zinc protease [Balneola sp. MJW-20]|uniref:ATP-dependent zinc protease family protein n=1 Tax=Gracilimonas aurantiaca TaxID=3234185 RepID=UPI003465F128
MQKIIGRTELVELPNWNFKGIEAKVDTGAYTSSLHCHHIEEVQVEGERYVQFYLLDPDHPAYNDQIIKEPVHDQREVKSSNGTIQLRYFVKTKISFFGEDFDIELSLTDRSEMKYPLLLGRKFLKRMKFLVDVNRKNLSQVKNKEE